MSLLLAVALGAWPPKQPPVEEVVERILWVTRDDDYRDEGYGNPIPLPSNEARRATLWLLDGAGEERRASFDFDERGRVVHETKYGPFNGPSEVETTREYGPFGLLCSTIQAAYDPRPTTIVRTYDAGGRITSSEWISSTGRSRSAMRLPTTAGLPVRILVVERDSAGSCEEHLHEIEGDERGRALRHLVDRGSDRILLDRWDLDDAGRLLRWVRLNEAMNTYYTLSVDRGSGRISVDTWGNRNEPLGSEDRYSFGEGTWVERSGVVDHSASTELLDGHGRVVRWFQTRYEDVLHSEVRRHRFDARGNLIECRHDVLLPRAKHDRDYGYRFDVEYRESR